MTAAGVLGALPKEPGSVPAAYDDWQPSKLPGEPRPSSGLWTCDTQTYMQGKHLYTEQNTHKPK